MDDFSRQEIEDTFQNADAMREVMNREIKKVPNAEGQDGHHAVYRGQHAHACFVRAGGQDSKRGRHQRVRLWQQRREGRIALQHRAHSAGHERRHHSDQAWALRRATLPGAAPRRMCHQRRRRAHAHPTQALLDMYTMRNYFGRVEGLKVTIIGDILYSPCRALQPLGTDHDGC